MQQKETPDFTILIMAIAFIIAAVLSSCASTGYGCKGNSKIMTRVR